MCAAKVPRGMLPHTTASWRKISLTFHDCVFDSDERKSGASRDSCVSFRGKLAHKMRSANLSKTRTQDAFKVFSENLHTKCVQIIYKTRTRMHSKYFQNLHTKCAQIIQKNSHTKCVQIIQKTPNAVRSENSHTRTARSGFQNWKATGVNQDWLLSTRCSKYGDGILCHWSRCLSRFGNFLRLVCSPRILLSLLYFQIFILDVGFVVARVSRKRNQSP